jgi:hypothetical protein
MEATMKWLILFFKWFFPQYYCQERGCTEYGIPCWAVCCICGSFWSGFESFEINHPGICDDCHDMLADDEDEFDYDRAGGYEEW